VAAGLYGDGGSGTGRFSVGERLAALEPERTGGKNTRGFLRGRTGRFCLTGEHAGSAGPFRGGKAVDVRRGCPGAVFGEVAGESNGESGVGFDLASMDLFTATFAQIAGAKRPWEKSRRARFERFFAGESGRPRTPKRFGIYSETSYRPCVWGNGKNRSFRTKLSFPRRSPGTGLPSDAEVARATDSVGFRVCGELRSRNGYRA